MAAHDLFRKEALDALEQSGHDRGEMLHLTPAWSRVAYVVLLAAFVGALSFATFAMIGEYASGPAVVRVEGRVDLTATASGTVESVEVQPGQRVSSGQLLVRFHAAQETAELERLESEHEAQLVKLLRDPGDQAARQALTSLRTQRELARAHAGQRLLLAPHDGVVSDVRIRPGQLLNAGDIALSLTGEHTRWYVVALLPGEYRPLLRPGLPLRLRMRGFARSAEMVRIASVGDEIVGPAEARRYLGPEAADLFAVNGPVVLVKAELAVPTFRVDDQSLKYYDGLPATAEARVRMQRVLVALIPGLRWIFTDGS